MNNLAKKKDIIELIRWYTLQPEQRDMVIPGYIKVALQIKQRKDDPDSIARAAWERISQDDFIEQFVPSFDKVFTHKEIKYLLNFYQSDVMKKFNTIGKNLFNEIYNGFNKIIQEIIESSSI